MKGFIGKILHIDLTGGTFEIEEPSESFYRKYVGGACMGAYYISKLVPPKIDAFSPENVIVVSTSAVVGAPVSGNSRFCVSSKSPLTGTIASSEAGGYWGPELKAAGFDCIIIRGRADEPVYIWIEDGKIEIRKADHLWGKVTGEVQDILKAELADTKVKILQIGPAGEKLVRFAGITNELRHFNGRNGIGAVMGSKKLRAIAVKGTQKVVFHDVEKIREHAKRGIEKVKDEESFSNLFKKYGTNVTIEGNLNLGGLPTNNWRMGTWDKADEISAEKYVETMMDKSGTCYGCAQACKRDVKPGIEAPWKIEHRYGGPEYETVGMLGSNCLVADLHAITKANELANMYCLDTISLGGVVSFVMECFEKKILTVNDTGGLNLTFGNAKALVQATELIGKREGFGDLMAEGAERLAKKLGPDAERICLTIKGKELPAHMPRAKGSLAIIYAVNPFGPDHISTGHDTDIALEAGESVNCIGLYEGNMAPYDINFEKAKFIAYSQRAFSAVDSWSVCYFCFNFWTIFTLTDLIEIIHAATGWNYSMQEFLMLGERRINLMRTFNAREGFTCEQDVLPERLFTDRFEDDGPRGGTVIDREDFVKARNDYYLLNGWNSETGNPATEKLKELGLEWLTDMSQ